MGKNGVQNNSIDAVFGKILHLESKYKLLTKTLFGIHYWELLRQKVLVHNLQQSGFYEGASAATVREIDGRLRIRPPVIKKGTAIFVHSTNRRVLKNGRYVDTYTEPIHELFKDDVVRIERQRVLDDYPAKLHLSGFTVRVLNYIARLIFRFLRPTRYHFKELQRILGEEELVMPGSHARFCNTISSFIASYVQVYRLAKRYKPLLAVFICSYGKESHIKAYRRLRIPTVEIQHGVITRYHGGYHFPVDRKHLFPDYLFLWGKGWKDAADFPIDSDHVELVGRESEDHLTDKTIAKDIDCCIISQPYFNETMLEYANRYKEANADHTVVFRPHPDDLSSVAEFRTRLNPGIFLSADTPIQEILRKSRQAVGISSTALFECLDLGVDTYILDVAASTYLDDFVQQGFFSRVSPNEFSLVPSISQRNPSELFRKDSTLKESLLRILG